MDQGATFSRQVVWKTGSPAAAVNMTGYSARMQARPSVSSASVVISLNTSNSGITITPLTGTITISAPASQTAAFPAGKFVYDLEVESSGGQVTRLMQGALNISPEVTR